MTVDQATINAEEAIRSGDEQAFAALAETYRRQLHVHCYRMLGSFDEAEDLVQETLLRAWRGRAGFDGRALFRTWLYRIATNTCLNALETAQRRILPADIAEPVTAATDASQARAEPPWEPDLPWLQPYPDSLLDQLAASEAEPDAVLVSRETIALTYLAALQHLPPRQRAIFILRDALGWSANEVGAMLQLTTVAVNSALQRARSSMRTHLTGARDEWSSAPPSTRDEQAALRTFMEAWERSDATMLTNLLRDDARWSMPPAPLWFDGRAAIVRLLQMFPIASNGEFRVLPTGANRQPAAATYIRHPGSDVFRFAGVHVLQVVDGGQIAEIVAFSEVLCAQFSLPATLNP